MSFLQIAFFVMPFCGLPFSVYASLRTASLRDAFLHVGSLRDASLRVASLLYAFLRVGSLRDASACCLFLCDTQMIVAFLEFLPFTVVFFLPTLTRYISDLTEPFSLLGY